MNNVNLDKYYKVGFISNKIAAIADFKFHGNVYAAPGVVKHIMKRHSSGRNHLNTNTINNIIETVSEILLTPDFVGKHPDKIGTSIEFVKKLDDNLLLALEVDLDNKYIYVASLYPISQGKINNRLNSGRLISLNNSNIDYVAATKP